MLDVNFARLIFRILQHFVTKFWNFTNFNKFFTGIYSFLPRSKISLTSKLSLRLIEFTYRQQVFKNWPEFFVNLDQQQNILRLSNPTLYFSPISLLGKLHSFQKKYNIKLEARKYINFTDDLWIKYCYCKKTTTMKSEKEVCLNHGQQRMQKKRMSTDYIY